MQNTDATCGPTALYNALCALGINSNLTKCELACETNQTGTESEAIIHAAAGIKQCKVHTLVGIPSTTIKLYRDFVPTQV